jgi:hypothetical protein
MSELRIVLRDTETGDEAAHIQSVDAERMADPDEPEKFYWKDGNAGCDCERARCLYAALGRPDPDIPCGDSRVVIVSATLDGVPLDWGEV